MKKTHTTPNQERDPSIIARLTPNDIEAASVYLSTPESEANHAATIYRSNLEFFAALRAKFNQLTDDPERIEAMLQASVLIVTTLNRRLDIEVLSEMMAHEPEVPEAVVVDQLHVIEPSPSSVSC